MLECTRLGRELNHQALFLMRTEIAALSNLGHVDEARAPADQHLALKQVRASVKFSKSGVELRKKRFGIQFTTAYARQVSRNNSQPEHDPRRQPVAI